MSKNTTVKVKKKEKKEYRNKKKLKIKKEVFRREYLLSLIQNKNYLIKNLKNNFFNNLFELFNWKKNPPLCLKRIKDNLNFKIILANLSKRNLKPINEAEMNNLNKEKLKFNIENRNYYKKNNDINPEINVLKAKIQKNIQFNPINIEVKIS
ncbi:MAG: hypothetical protein ACTSQJ_13065 [Promethearchaeota archaeon]